MNDGVKPKEFCEATVNPPASFTVTSQYDQVGGLISIPNATPRRDIRVSSISSSENRFA